LSIARNPCHEVKSYEELLEKIAYLNFYNPSLNLVFRGQDADYQWINGDREDVRSNLHPSIFRGLPTNRPEAKSVVSRRVGILEKAENLLKEKIGTGYLYKHRVLRWAILQHYEICQTPLLDVTNSLQTALSFAFSNDHEKGYLYVLGLPQSTGPISTSLESMTQLIDLSKLCPPDAARPHYQHGLLLGDYPSGLDLEEITRRAPHVSSNFACRLLTKFQLTNMHNWVGNSFTPTPKDILFPNSHDTYYRKLIAIKDEANA